MKTRNGMNHDHLHILVADDDPGTRALAARALAGQAGKMMEASDGLEAWKLVQETPVDLIVTDWSMPNMGGPELCRKVRADKGSGYTFIIVMTASQGGHAVVESIKAGADDFILKPINPEELQARVKAAERILKLQRDLEERNARLEDSNKKLSHAYSVIQRDLKAGAQIQANLMPHGASLICGIRFDFLFLPSAIVAGDLFNYFRLDEQYVGFYVIDVAGHGIPAALSSVTLSKALSPTNNQHCILKQFMPDPDPPFYKIITPGMAVKSLNERFQTDEQVMQYFTMVYGHMDSQSGEVVFTQAGHPSPIHMRFGKKATFVGDGGFPVGMLPDVEYQDVALQLDKGDRLFLYSDGITECFNDNREIFSADRLLALLDAGRDLPLHAVMGSVKKALFHWKGNVEFEDDITLLGIEKG